MIKFKPLGRYQVLKSTYGQQQQVPVNPAFSGAPSCIYFTGELWTSTVTQDSVPTITLNCNYHLAKICDYLWKGTVGLSAGSMGPLVNSSTNVDTNITTRVQIRSKLEYVVRNAINETSDFEAYYCKPRRNVRVPNNTNIYHQLATGFATNGIDPTHSSAITNLAMNDPNFTPFNSENFVMNYKIVKVRRFKIMGGEEKRFRVRHRSFLFKPADFFDIFGTSSPATWAAASQLYTNNKYERFILFRAVSRVTGTGSGFIGGYSQRVSHDQPVFNMEQWYEYRARIMWQPKTPYGTLDNADAGYTALAGGTSIINSQTYLLSTPAVVT